MIEKRILVIEGNKQWGDHFTTILKTEKYIVDLAKDSFSGIGKTKEVFYPVIVVDIHSIINHDKGLNNALKELGDNHKIIFGDGEFESDLLQSVFEFLDSNTGAFMAKRFGKIKQKLLSEVKKGFARFNRPIDCPLTLEECNKKIHFQPKQIFVAMPYLSKSGGAAMNMDDLYELAISEACNQMGFETKRADENPFTGALLCNICKDIQESAFCIVDVTEWNPNVLFELGLMYGFGKTTIIIKHENYDMPTDLKFVLYIEYDSIKSLIPELAKTISEI